MTIKLDLTWKIQLLRGNIPLLVVYRSDDCWEGGEEVCKEEEEAWVKKERGERQGEKEPNTRTKHRAIICTERTTQCLAMHVYAFKTHGRRIQAATLTIRHVPVWVEAILQVRGTTFPEISDWSFWNWWRSVLQTHTIKQICPLYKGGEKQHWENLVKKTRRWVEGITMIKLGKEKKSMCYPLKISKETLDLT